MKSVANEIFGVLERYNKGQCTYDRALEDASSIIENYADTKPIVGYIKTGRIKEIFVEILKNKPEECDEIHNKKIKIHTNIYNDIKNITDKI